MLFELNAEKIRNRCSGSSSPHYGKFGAIDYRNIPGAKGRLCKGRLKGVRQMYRAILIFLLCYVILFGGFILKKDTLTNRTKIYTKDGRLVGYIKENSLQNKHDIFDRNEQRKGYIKKNTWPDRLDIFDQNQQRKGYIKKNTFLKDRYDVFDQNQRRKGYIKKNDFLYDTYGNEVHK